MKKIIALLSISLLLTGCTNQKIAQTKNTQENQISKEVIVEKQEDETNIGDLYYIRNIYTKNNKTFIDIDNVEWLSASDNTCSTPPEEKTGIPQCNPNGFLIQNSIKKINTYEILASINIQTINFNTNPLSTTNMDLKEFTEFFTSQKEYFDSVPFTIQVDNGLVINIQEKYIP